MRLGLIVGSLGLEKARKLFHDQDERFNESNRDVLIGPIPCSQKPAAALHRFLEVVRLSWHALENDTVEGTPR